MELKDVLNQVPGLNKRLIYYLEAQGYIRPVQVRKLRISRRDYSADDLRHIKHFWTYYERGFSVRGAIDAAVRAEQARVVVFLPVPARDRGCVLDLVRGYHQVFEAAVVYGETGDLILWVSAADERDAYSVLDPLFERASVGGIPRIWRVDDRWPSDRGGPRQSGVERCPEEQLLAYVLIKAPPKQVGDVLDQLRKFHGIVEACVLYGESDVIAKIMVSTQAELDDLVMKRIQSLTAVESTRTFIAVGGMHWERNADEQGG